MSLDNKQITPKVMITFLILSAAFLAISCKECPTEPPTPDYRTDLLLDYAGPSFVSLYFSISDSGKTREYIIQRDTSIVLTGTLQGADTIVTDWAAEPSTTYRYQLLLQKNGKTVDTSETITVKSMDTTSHNFVWERIKLCDGGGDIHDVEVVDEDNVWVVGEFFPKPDIGEYFPNVAHWDGTEWKLQQIKYGGPIYDILYISENDIWVSVGIPLHWDGDIWTIYHLWNMGVLKSGEGPVWHIWGSSSNNMYFIGDRGTIVYYNGQQFKKIPDVPNFEYYCIDGIEDPDIYGERIWVGFLNSGPERGGLIFYNGLEWQTLWSNDIQFFSDPVYRTVGSIWTTPEDQWVVIYTGGHTDGIITIHNQKYFNDYRVYIKSWKGFIRAVDGNDINDFFAVGDFNCVIHYNGKSFKYYPELNYDNHYVSVSQKGDVVYIANISGAIIYKGIRN